ncbi:MAG: VWA domain-containing protein [Verrucomicrobia bacterium]|nr:VWA domain-containing protein [Verrucomicrobiota bacterium]
MSHWSFATSLPLILLGAAVWGAAAWLSWTNWRRRRTRSSALLESLRLVIVTLLGFTLLRPEFVKIIQRTEQPEIAVLLDASGSMVSRDIKQGSNIVTRAAWLGSQRAAKFWAPLERSAKVLVEEFSTPPRGSNVTAAAVADSGTDLNAALDGVLLRSKNLKAVLVLTDGDWNAGKSPLGTATRFREQNVPVFAVGVGAERPLPDLILEKVTAPSYGLIGEQISIPFKIQNHLPREIKTTLTIAEPDGEETKREVTIPALGQLADAVVWSPRLVGETTLKLRVPPESDEALTDNNELPIRIAVRSETLKVLVVDSLPRWEYRYLRNALERDPGVEMHCLLYHPGMVTGGGRGYLPTFPSSKELLSKYDVIFLGDVGMGDGELTERDCELIRGLVEQQSSGLVFLPGRRGRELTFLKSPLAELFPVTLDERKPEGIGLQNEGPLMLTSMGKGHLLTRFDADENRNDEIWKALPGFYWSAAVEKSRPGSEVLAVHSSQRNTWGRIPLLVTRSAGSGKVLFMGTDSAWRWRRGVEDKYHYRFWSQVARWMAHQRHLSERPGIRLTFSPETPQVGDTVFLQTTVLDASGFPVERGPVAGRITSPGGRVERLDFGHIEGGWGVFKSQFVAQAGGAHKILVTADTFGRRLETEVNITQPVREKVGQPANHQILRELSALTGGAVTVADDLKGIIEKISALPEPKPLELRIRLWSNPWWGGSILFLLAVYWIGRKFAGML